VSEKKSSASSNEGLAAGRTGAGRDSEKCRSRQASTRIPGSGACEQITLDQKRTGSSLGWKWLQPLTAWRHIGQRGWGWDAHQLQMHEAQNW
jgi:hypothetical protein